MANKVDSDQTAPSGVVWSGSILFAYAILSETSVYEILGLLLYLIIHRGLVKEEYLMIILG